MLCWSVIIAMQKWIKNLTKNTTLKICRTHFKKLTLQQSASLDFLGFTFFFLARRAPPSFFFPSAIVVDYWAEAASLVYFHLRLFMMSWFPGKIIRIFKYYNHLICYMNYVVNTYEVLEFISSLDYSTTF